VRNGGRILPTKHLFHACRVLLHAVNLRHGADGFTSPPKEGVLRIFITLKFHRPRPGLNLGSSGKHANHYTTEGDCFLSGIIILTDLYSETNAKPEINA
jgi:hypothetical protein